MARLSSLRSRRFRVHLLLKFVDPVLVGPVLTWLALTEVSNSEYATRNLLMFPQLKQTSLGMTVEQDVHSALELK